MNLPYQKKRGELRSSPTPLSTLVHVTTVVVRPVSSHSELKIECVAGAL